MMGRVIVTAAHCLPKLPRAGALDAVARTYRALVGPFGEKPGIAVECLFADPVADVAVLGCPDGEELPDDYRGFTEFLETRRPLAMPAVARDPSVTNLRAWLLGLDGQWMECAASAHEYSGLWLSEAQRPIVPGMSGSPILTGDGTAIGIITVASDGPMSGPQARLPIHLPGWIAIEAARLSGD